MNEIVQSLLSNNLLVTAGTLLGTLILKDVVSTTASGLMFARNRNFNVGDDVVIDGVDARIISIGWRQTIFEVEGTWLYYYNDQIRYMKLGKRKDNGKEHKING